MMDILTQYVEISRRVTFLVRDVISCRFPPIQLFLFSMKHFFLKHTWFNNLMTY